MTILTMFVGASTALWLHATVTYAAKRKLWPAVVSGLTAVVGIFFVISLIYWS